jgi:hypothetical protein
VSSLSFCNCGALEEPEIVVALMQREALRARARAGGSAHGPRSCVSTSRRAWLGALSESHGPGRQAGLRPKSIEPAPTARKARLGFSSAT